VPFTNVPAGCRVQITRISGDFIAWAKGAVPAGTYAGVLMGACQTGGTGSTRAAYAADGYFLYYQDGLSKGPASSPSAAFSFLSGSASESAGAD
jgi:hypothetical protein